MLDGVSLAVSARLLLNLLRRVFSRSPWRAAESSVKHARLGVGRLWKQVEQMPGDRSDVFAALGRVAPLLIRAEEALIAARRASEDIDRRKELTEGDPNLNLVWKFTGEQQQLPRDDGEQEGVER